MGFIISILILFVTDLFVYLEDFQGVLKFVSLKLFNLFLKLDNKYHVKQHSN